MGETLEDRWSAMVDLLDRSHRLAPFDLPPALQETARRLGADRLEVYLVDYAQRWLHPSVEVTEPLPIDGTLAGRVFAFGRAEHGRDDEHTALPVLYLPLVDGSDRLGVMAFHADLTPEREEAFRALTSIAGELIVTKSNYGDVFATHRRRAPMSLAAEMQWDLLPPLTYRTDCFSVAALLEPVYDIGGDSFDYSHADGVVDIAVIDAVGRGMEAALLAVTVMGSIRNSRRSGSTLEEAYLRADCVIRDRFAPVTFVTAQLARVDLGGGVLRWVKRRPPEPAGVPWRKNHDASLRSTLTASRLGRRGRRGGGTGPRARRCSAVLL